MQEIVGNVDTIHFDIEVALDQQLGAQPLPFPGMDKSGAAICTFYLRGLCNKSTACPFRHVKGDQTVVCKHWLRGLCKKGDDCEFLHEYDMSKMPECYFFSKFGQCSNKECPFLHIDPNEKIKDCPWYDRGFCRHGPDCRNRHVRRILCINYLVGFCPDGPSCKYMHPSFDLPAMDPVQSKRTTNLVCHFCNEAGHKAYQCRKYATPGQENTPPSQRETQAKDTHERHERHYEVHERKPIGEVTCFKCGEKGHYANKCPKGHLAFLSNPGITANS